jgi:hypothetical protein
MRKPTPTVFVAALALVLLPGRALSEPQVAPSGAASASAPATKRAGKVDFVAAEKNYFSQSGEDGVIEKIFEIIEPTSKYAVEFGAYDGVEYSNTRHLVLEKGWSALMMEGDEKLAAKMVESYKDNPRVKAKQAWIYPGNVELLFEENGVPKDLDLLVIDIDSNDWYVWRVIHDFHPKVVVLDVNPFFAPPQKMVIDFHPMNYWDKTDYFGASLQSLYELGKKKGYELVYHNQLANTAFFVQQKYFDRFGIEDNSPAALFSPPSHALWKFFDRSPQGRGETPFAPGNDVLTWDQLKIQKKFRTDR